jgi:hypothetical protein
MVRHNVVAIAILALTVTACASSTVPRDSGDADRLLALHEEGLRAHRESDVDLLLRAEEDRYTVSSNGAVSHPNRDQRRRFLGPYLESTRFSVYRDQIPPVVQVSADGSLGWVIAQIEAKGEQTAPDGKVEPLEFVSSWIELYEKRGGRWIRVGNVSNFKPEPAGA